LVGHEIVRADEAYVHFSCGAGGVVEEVDPRGEIATALGGLQMGDHVHPPGPVALLIDREQACVVVPARVQHRVALGHRQLLDGGGPGTGATALAPLPEPAAVPALLPVPGISRERTQSAPRP